MSVLDDQSVACSNEVLDFGASKDPSRCPPFDFHDARKNWTERVSRKNRICLLRDQIWSTSVVYYYCCIFMGQNAVRVKGRGILRGTCNAQYNIGI